MSTTKIPLYIKVDAFVKQFIVRIYGSDVVDVGQQDALFERIKYILQLAPKEFKNPAKGDHVITVFIPKFRILNKQINNLYRNNLDDRRQKMIASEFKKLFKQVFHNYVFGYCRSNINKNTDENQKEAIYDFCSSYQINMDEILFETLKKSWDRSDEKKILKSIKNTKNYTTDYQLIKNKSRTPFVPCKNIRV